MASGITMLLTSLMVLLAALGWVLHPVEARRPRDTP